MQDTIDAKGLVGELDHPSDSIIHFANASHVVNKLWWEANKLMGEATVLSTPHGKVLKALISDGIRVGISSRGVGNGKVNEDGILVIGDSYRLITFDTVADPSTFAAFQEKVVAASKRESHQPTKFGQVSQKNEGRSIHTMNKDLLIACLGGMINQNTSNKIARM